MTDERALQLKELLGEYVRDYAGDGVDPDRDTINDVIYDIETSQD